MFGSKKNTKELILPDPALQTTQCRTIGLASKTCHGHEGETQ